MATPVLDRQPTAVEALVARRRVPRLLSSLGQRTRAARAGEQLIVFAAAFVIWEIVTRARGSFFFPPPSDVLNRAYENWFSGPASSLFLTPAVGEDLTPSLVRMMAGWAVAVGVGIGLGTLLGLGRRLAAYVEPTVHFLRSAPGPALLPVFLVVFGVGTSMKVAFIAFGAVWPILLNTIEGVRSVDVRQLDTAAAFRVGRRRRVAQVILPSATPKVVAGLRISLAIALVLMVISDMVSSSEGFGFFLVRAQREFRILDVWAGIVVLGAIGYILNAVFLALEHRYMGWHFGWRGREKG
jgi:ABC-type nitrate/sulfonate/bicarbonate transport system permease component